MQKTISVIPAAGSATRMSGIPKFLIPNSEGTPLIRWHVSQSNLASEHTIVVTRPEWAAITFEVLSGLKFELQCAVTNTMTETVIIALQSRNPAVALIHMPDTFLGEDNKLAQAVSTTLEEKQTSLICWKTRADQKGKLGQVMFQENLDGSLEIFKIVDKDPVTTSDHHWGAIAFFQPDVQNWDPKDSHVGITAQKMLEKNPSLRFRAIFSNEAYYDCGTSNELSTYLQSIIKS